MPLNLPFNTCQVIQSKWPTFIPDRWRSPTTLEFGSCELTIPTRDPGATCPLIQPPRWKQSALNRSSERRFSHPRPLEPQGRIFNTPQKITKGSGKTWTYVSPNRIVAFQVSRHFPLQHDYWRKSMINLSLIRRWAVASKNSLKVHVDCKTIQG